MLTAGLLSAGGVVVSVAVTGDADDGGRGGALAVALTLVAYFLRRDLGLSIATAFTRTAPAIDRGIDELEAAPGPAAVPAPLAPPAAPATPAAPLPPAPLDNRVQALETRAQVEAQSERLMQRAAALAAAIGTLAWGFGDLLARALIG